MVKKIFFSLCFWALAAAVVSAQTYALSIKGTLKKPDGTPVSGVAVTVTVSSILSNAPYSTTLSATTNALGKYETNANVPLGVVIGRATVKFTDCNQQVVSRLRVFTRNSPNIQQNLTWCPSGGGGGGIAGCSVQIVEQPQSGSTQLNAQTTATGNVSYAWSTGATTAQITVTQSGSYCVTVTRVQPNNFCMTAACKTIQVTNAQAAATDRDGAACNVSFVETPQPDGSVHLQSQTAATGQYTLTWNTGATTPDIVVAQSGSYCVQVEQPTASGNCLSSFCRYVVANGAASATSDLDASSAIRLYPNPVQNELTVSLSEPQEIAWSVIGADGRVLNNGVAYASDTFGVPTAELSAGLYCLRLQAANGTVTKRFLKQKNQ
jgi:Secretion system C-terminal sorting domain